MSDLQIVAILFIAGCIVYLVDSHLKREYIIQKMKYEVYLRSLNHPTRLRQVDEDFINDITANL